MFLQTILGRAYVWSDDLDGHYVAVEMYEFPDRQRDKSSKVIELSQRDVEDAARLLSLLVDDPSVPPTILAKDDQATDPAAVLSPPSHERLLKLASKAFEARQRRNRIFHPGLFGEAAWDMLLILYSRSDTNPRMTIAGVSKAAGIPTTTTLRWLDTLEDQGLIVRQPHPHDARSSLVSLAAKGQGLLEAYFSETLASLR